MKPFLLPLPRAARRDDDHRPASEVPVAGGMGLRHLVLAERAKMVVDEERRTIEVSFSSEEPVTRYWGTEILDHAAKSCDLTRLKRSGPVLMDHDRRDQVGVVEKAWVADKVGRAVLRFGKSARAQEIWQDILDGIRRNVSVTYQIEKVVLESQDIASRSLTEAQGLSQHDIIRPP